MRRPTTSTRWAPATRQPPPDLASSSAPTTPDTALSPPLHVPPRRSPPNEEIDMDHGMNGKRFGNDGLTRRALLARAGSAAAGIGIAAVGSSVAPVTARGK